MHFSFVFSAIAPLPKFFILRLIRFRVWNSQPQKKQKGDLRTVMGRTMAEISKECIICDPSFLTPTLIKKKMLYRGVPAEENWRLGLLNELLEKKLEIPGFMKDELKEIIDFACT